MVKKIIFATGNQNKMREIREIMGNLPVEILSMKEAGIKADIEEDGTTFEENAVIKAKAVADLLPEKDKEAIVLADDSGLEIDALNGEPGIYSARYMGEDTSYHIKNSELIRRLEGVPVEKRTARFVCAVAAVLPDRTCLTVRGTIEGRIGYEERGSNGFGYDPIFYYEPFKTTLANVPLDLKNQVSHRHIALMKLLEYLDAKE